jgi:hypothetical protein
MLRTQRIKMKKGMSLMELNNSFETELEPFIRTTTTQSIRRPLLPVSNDHQWTLQWNRLQVHDTSDVDFRFESGRIVKNHNTIALSLQPQLADSFARCLIGESCVLISFYFFN